MTSSSNLIASPATCLSAFRTAQIQNSRPAAFFASRALALGETLPVIGKLLGHSQVQTTTPYARLARDAIQSVVARITGSIGDNLSSMLRFDDTAKR